MKLSDLAERLDARLFGAGDTEIRGVAGISDARRGDIAYLAESGRWKELEMCQASAVIVPLDVPTEKLILPSLAVKNPRYAFALALGIFYGRAEEPGGISDRAAIGKDAVIGLGATIHPFACVGEGARIGERSTLYPGVCIAPGAVIGMDCTLYANVAVYRDVTIGDRVIVHAGAVIGSDGFGFVTEGGRHHKIPQVGGVVIGDDVEIGSNTTIDRATLGNTVIANGTKIDNLVQIAHNVSIGEHCLLASQVGIAGSSKLGSYVVMGGRVGMGDHLKVGERVMAGGGAMITRNVEAGQIIAGHYAMPLKDWLKIQAVLPRLPDLRKQANRLEQRIEELEKALRASIAKSKEVSE